MNDKYDGATRAHEFHQPYIRLAQEIHDPVPDLRK